MSLDGEMKEALNTFTVESLELLEEMEHCLLNLEDSPDKAERVNEIFRIAHTIKGSSGLFGLEHIVSFTHVVENVLDWLREGKIAISADLIAVLLPCCDHIALLIRLVAQGQLQADPDLTGAGDKLLGELRSLTAIDPDKSIVRTAEEDKVETLSRSDVEEGNWHLSIRFGADSLRDGMDPLSFIRYLSTLGDIVQLTTVTEAIPEAELMDAETNYLGFEIDFNSSADKEDIENVFEFVRDSSTIKILPHDSAIADFVQLIRELPEDDHYLGQILVNSGVLTEHELEQALSYQEIEKHQSDQGDHAEPAHAIGEILVEQQAVQQPLVNAALEKQKNIKDNRLKESQSIRIDAERLDKLIDLIGELVISGAGVNLRAMLSGDSVLLEATEEVLHLVEEVRDTALQLRMVPIGTTFSRFQRVVRDVSQELGKDIHLVISGGDTEVDKSVVEKISDPLMHLVRNSMDHGIESAELRRQLGKPEQGTLTLNAYHESGSIVIEVGDDGGGLKREKIFEKAVEKGLVTSDANLSDQEIYALIFEPGFSTAAKVSNLSGRGVGMDVVKRNITALRGTIEVESQPELGATMRIRLPLTLAIIDGFLVNVGQSTFVIPLERVVECVELPSDVENRDYMDLRGEVLPFIRLRTLFEIEGEQPRRENVVVVQFAGMKTGFVVDRLMGEFQTVIKPLGKLFAHIKGLAGSTILGNGKVALILDVPSLVDCVQHGYQKPLAEIDHDHA